MKIVFFNKKEELLKSNFFFINIVASVFFVCYNLLALKKWVRLVKIISYVNNYFKSLLTGIYGEENISRFLKMWVNYIVLVDIVNINILHNKSIVLTIYSFINVLYMIYLVSIIKKAKYELFCRNIFGVILLYIILFTLFMGWNSGFVNLMFGMTVSFFCCFIFSKICSS